jgi:hypothetical protein
MLRNDCTVPTRCRYRGGIVDPLGCKACRAIRQPISPSIQIQDHSIQNHPKPVSFLSAGVSSGSSLTPLNPTITHTQSPHLAFIASLAIFVIIDFSARNYNRTCCAWYRQRSHPWQRITLPHENSQRDRTSRTASMSSCDSMNFATMSGTSTAIIE